MSYFTNPTLPLSMEHQIKMTSKLRALNKQLTSIAMALKRQPPKQANPDIVEIRFFQ